jgi:hypothetical protein
MRARLLCFGLLGASLLMLAGGRGRASTRASKTAGTRIKGSGIAPDRFAVAVETPTFC